MKASSGGDQHTCNDDRGISVRRTLRPVPAGCGTEIQPKPAELKTLPTDIARSPHSHPAPFSNGQFTTTAALRPARLLFLIRCPTGLFATFAVAIFRVGRIVEDCQGVFSAVPSPLYRRRRDLEDR